VGVGSEARGGDTRIVIKDVITNFQFNIIHFFLLCAIRSRALRFDLLLCYTHSCLICIQPWLHD